MINYEETLELLKKAKNNDVNAKNELIIQNTPLIKSVIKYYKNKGVDYDDLFQLGSMGFLKAIQNFDFSLNIKFSTYAVPMIAGEVKRFMRDDGSIKVSRSLKTLFYNINKYMQEHQKTHNDSPTILELSKHFNVDEDEILLAIDSNKNLISLDAKFEDGDSNDKTIGDNIEEEKPLNIINKIFIDEMLSKLQEKEQNIIKMRYFQDLTQSEVAKRLNISQVQVSRIETKIIQKLRQKYS